MRYFHNEMSKTVYAVEEPTVERRYSSRNKARHAGLTLFATIHVTSATNVMQASGVWARPWREIKSQDFDNSYSEAQARGWFEGHLAVDGVEIGREEYERLVAEYKRQAHENTI
ncbi:hypothetical protein WME88_35635 [Sorangium sp. So ce216]